MTDIGIGWPLGGLELPRRSALLPNRLRRSSNRRQPACPERTVARFAERARIRLELADHPAAALSSMNFEELHQAKQR